MPKIELLIKLMGIHNFSFWILLTRL